MEKDLKTVTDYNAKRQDDILLGQAINNAAILLSGSLRSVGTAEMAGLPMAKYKALVKLLYQASKEAKQELQNG